jgi:hypothetical protein
VLKVLNVCSKNVLTKKELFLLCHKYSPFAFQVRRVRIDQKRKENKKGNLNKREEEKKADLNLSKKGLALFLHVTIGKQRKVRIVKHSFPLPFSTRTNRQK